MNADTHMCGLDPLSEYADLAAEVFSLLSDPTRVRIVLALRSADELSVNKIAESVGKSPTAVSQHLAKLRMARVVATRQQAQKVMYRLANRHVAQLVADAILQAEHSVASPDTPPHHHKPESGR